MFTVSPTITIIIVVVIMIIIIIIAVDIGIQLMVVVALGSRQYHQSRFVDSQSASGKTRANSNDSKHRWIPSHVSFLP